MKSKKISTMIIVVGIVLASVFFCSSVSILPAYTEYVPAPSIRPVEPTAAQTPENTGTATEPTGTSTPLTEPTPDPEPDPEPEPEPTDEYFTIAMMGDCTLASEHNSKSNAYAYENVVGDDYAYPFSMTKPLYESADFTIVNLECAMCEYNVPERKTFRMRAEPEYVNILLEGGVDFAALGNNHVMDYGQRGYAETQELLAANGIGFAPNGGWSLHTTDAGLTIGVYSKNLVNEADVRKAVPEMKEAGAELIIMALHWGDEGKYRADASQKQIGRAAIDAGAHIVMGSHPHTLQATEEYNGGYIYYSLGNWSFGGNTNPRDKDTILALLTVKRDVDGKITVEGAENIPCSSSGSETINDYRPVPYEPDSEGYLRTLSKLDGSFTGPDLVVSYDFLEENLPDGSAGQPDAGQPDAGQPDAGQPDVEQPDTEQPDAE